jgi:hypothetical protein
MFTSNGGATDPHFDNARFEQVVERFQRTGDASSLSEIVELSQQRALTLIRFNGTHRYWSEDELLSDINYKLMRGIYHRIAWRNALHRERQTDNYWNYVDKARVKAGTVLPLPLS